MSYLDDLTRRKPDLFSDAERRKMIAQAQFRAWQSNIDGRAQQAEDANLTASGFVFRTSNDPVRAATISIPVLNRPNTGPV